MGLWEPTRHSRTIPKDVLFIIGDWNAKVGSQEISWVRQVWSLSTKWNSAKSNRALPREYTGHRIIFQQHKRQFYIRMSLDGQYRNQIDYILCSQRWRSSIQWAKTRPGADCGSDHEHLIAIFRLKLRTVGKTTKPFRCNLNQIPYDYTVKVMNRFKGLYMTQCLKNYGHRFVQGVVTKTIPKKKKCKKAKWLSAEALQIAEKRKEVKGKEERER